MKSYTVERKQYSSIDICTCSICGAKRNSIGEMETHIEVMHKPKEKMKKSELIELAKEHGVAIRGSAKEITERLQEEGIL